MWKIFCRQRWQIFSFFFSPFFVSHWVWEYLPLLIWTCFMVFDLLTWVGVQRRTWSGWHQYLGWLSVFLFPFIFFFFLFYLFKAEVFSSVNRHTEVSVAQLVVISWIYRWNDRIPWAYAYSLFLYLSNTLSFLPRRHKQKDLRGNLCRNPDNSTTGPWCFTKNPSIRYQNCNIPQCSQGKLPFTYLNSLNNSLLSYSLIWFFNCFLWVKKTFC